MSQFNPANNRNMGNADLSALGIFLEQIKSGKFRLMKSDIGSNRKIYSNGFSANFNFLFKFV
jgi:hypothetical protein